MVTGEEWKLTCAVEEFWHREKFFPSARHLAEDTGLAENLVLELINSERLSTRFEKLGIDKNATPVAKKGELKKNESRLTDKQLAVAMTLLNPMDTRSLSGKLKALGVLPATYHGWTKNKVFAEFMVSQAEEMFGSAMPIAHSSLLSKVMQGDVRAIKLYYEMNGRYNRQDAANEQNFKLLVYRLIEILQKYVNDPIVLQQISEEVKGLITPTPPVARGELVYDNNS